MRVGLCISFHNYHNTAPQTGWLETIEMYCFIIVEASSAKSRCSRGPGKSFLVSFLWFAGILWSSLACTCVTPVSAFITTLHSPCVFLSSHPLTRIQVILDWRPTLVNLTSCICSDPVSNEVRYWGTGGYDFSISFLRYAELYLRET